MSIKGRIQLDNGEYYEEDFCTEYHVLANMRHVASGNVTIVTSREDTFEAAKRVYEKWKSTPSMSDVYIEIWEMQGTIFYGEEEE